MFERKENPVIIGLIQQMRFCLYVILGAGVLSSASLSSPKAKVVPSLRADPRSGQIVKTVVISSRVVESRIVGALASSSDLSLPLRSTPLELKTLVEEAARNYELSPALVESVIQVESNYNPNAVSPKGAQGLMQLMPATARRFGVRDSFDPKQNIEGGVRYLKFLHETFKDERLAIAAYNAGEGAVQRYGNVPPYPETLSYVAKVGQKYGQARRTAETANKRNVAEKLASTPKPPEYRRLAQYIDAQGRVFLSTQ